MLACPSRTELALRCTSCAQLILLCPYTLACVPHSGPWPLLCTCEASVASLVAELRCAPPSDAPSICS